MRIRTLVSTIAAVLLVTPLTAQQVLFRHHGDLFPVRVAATNLAAVVRALLAGPSPQQQAAGLDSAIPRGVRLVALEAEAGAALLTLSEEFVTGDRTEDAIEQITKTVLDYAPLQRVSLVIRTAAGGSVPLSSLLPTTAVPALGAPLPATPPMPATGALSGKTIAVSPGHGWYWHSTLGWTTQRPTIDGLTEDFHTNEIAMHYLIPALENLGARVISCRERGEIAQEVVGDNDQGSAVYQETGAWSLSGSSGYGGGTYRFANTTAVTTATATWTVPLPADGSYPVHVFFRAGTNRSTDAHYQVWHSGGVTDVVVDQTQDDLRWVHAGDFWFTQAAGAKIVLENRSANPGPVVIADAVRVGAGLGTIVRGTSSSGKPKWQECSRYWAELAGAPSSVYDIVGLSDDGDDVTARPKYAEWRGADAYISLHTNAGGGLGTSSYIHDTAPTPGSAQLQTATHNQIIADIRAYYDPTWADRGKLSANFGEVRALTTMPGVLLELAFHDVAGSKDHKALHDPRFRSISGRAYARGVLRYFNSAAAFAPDEPTALRVTQDGNRGLLVAWDAAPGAIGYSIEQSPDGKGFVEVAQTNSTSWSTGPLAHGAWWSFRVRAYNATGRSFPTEVLTAGTSHDQRAELLLVQGFDRFDRYVKRNDNTQDYLRLHAEAIRLSNEFSLGFDAASNEALMLGYVPLAAYRAVDWVLGEESTADETFSTAEQALVQAYVQAGGRLLVSGAEVGWDLDFKGSAQDRAFYRSVLGAIYTGDDAGTYAFAPGTGIFAGLPGGTFDNGQSGTYDVDYPDVVAAADGLSQTALTYSGGQVAALQRISGTARVVYLGFPLETVTSASLRSQLMTRALRFLLAPLSFDAPSATVLLGATLPLTINLPGEGLAPYVLASSLGLGSLPLPGGGILPLQPDGVFSVSLTPNPVFVGFQGTLDSAGSGNAAFVVPGLPVLVGLDFYFCGVTVSGSGGVQTVLPWVRARVV